MTITRLGQAGLWLETEKTKILVDPYFTDSAFYISGVHRKKDCPEQIWELKPDLLLLTHDHIDHYDPDTAKRFVNAGTSITVLSPKSVWEKIRQNGGGNNYVLVEPGVQWTQSDVAVTAVKAYHSDAYAVGFVIEAEGKKLCVTGDTLFVPGGVAPFENADYIFLPVNGRGNNMNAADAAKLCELIGAKHAVPVHYGMLDDLTPDIFEYKNRLIMEDFKEYSL